MTGIMVKWGRVVNLYCTRIFFLSCQDSVSMSWKMWLGKMSDAEMQRKG